MQDNIVVTKAETAAPEDGITLQSMQDNIVVTGVTFVVSAMTAPENRFNTIDQSIATVKQEIKGNMGDLRGNMGDMRSHIGCLTKSVERLTVSMDELTEAVSPTLWGIQNYCDSSDFDIPSGLGPSGNQLSGSAPGPPRNRPGPSGSGLLRPEIAISIFVTFH
ncbi:hypothetical protein K439DRAFT_762221 [Ramaria rubella]|nr:hypothetical protein K439DRAFT_762221 [Ramaria rubella]